jgi:glycosyltransferase involved in cell wall biosynthesis
MKGIGDCWLPKYVTAILEGRRPTHGRLLAVDDGSTDGSYGRLLHMSVSDSRIRAFRFPDNRGAATARNLALREARGEIVTYLDCLDQFYPDYLEHLHNWPKEADVCLFCYELFPRLETALLPRRGDKCLTILRNCHRAMQPACKLLVIESVIPPGNEPRLKD